MGYQCFVLECQTVWLDFGVKSCEAVFCCYKSLDMLKYCLCLNYFLLLFLTCVAFWTRLLSVWNLLVFGHCVGWRLWSMCYYLWGMFLLLLLCPNTFVTWTVTSGNQLIVHGSPSPKINSCKNMSNSMLPNLILLQCTASWNLSFSSKKIWNL